MSRMQLCLPDEPYELVKARGRPASELFQRAVRAEVRRLELLERTDEDVASLSKEVGVPTAAERKRAAATADKLDAGSSKRAG